MNRKTGEVRIIGGRWRRRKIVFPAADGVRPTPDRVRETLFNWLRDDVTDALCLDLFSGSGVLGLEAASRGARRVVMVERDRRMTAAIRRAASDLGAENVEVLTADATTFRPADEDPFDIIFLDPPYRGPRPETVLAGLDAAGLTHHETLAYIESDRDVDAMELPPGWGYLKSQRAGQVRYYLAARS